MINRRDEGTIDLGTVISNPYTQSSEPLNVSNMTNLFESPETRFILQLLWKAQYVVVNYSPQWLFILGTEQASVIVYWPTYPGTVITRFIIWYGYIALCFFSTIQF